MGQTGPFGRFRLSRTDSHFAGTACRFRVCVYLSQWRPAFGAANHCQRLRLDDESVCIAVALRVSSELGSPHPCRYGSLVDASGTHSLVCKHAPSQMVRHHALNECISRAFATAGIPVKKTSPECCTLIPWHGGRPLAWDVAVCTTMAESYVNSTSQAAGAMAEQAADKKCSKYAELSASYGFQPVALETHGPSSVDTRSLLAELGCKISERTGEPLETQFLFQQISVLL